MLFSDFLIGALIFIVSFTPATHGNCTGDEAPLPDEQLFGKDNCCCFEYANGVKIENLKGSFPTAEEIAVGRLPQYRLDFVDFEDKGISTFFTVVPDEAEEVYGMAYKSSIADYLAYVKAASSLDKYWYSVRVTVEVTKNGEIQRIPCNTFVAVHQPPKETPLPNNRRPWKSILDDTLQASKDAGLPPAYIEKISKTLTRDC